MATCMLVLDGKIINGRHKKVNYMIERHDIYNKKYVVCDDIQSLHKT
jgi:hypothetical protein